MHLMTDKGASKPLVLVSCSKCNAIYYKRDQSRHLPACDLIFQRQPVKIEHCFLLNQALLGDVELTDQCSSLQNARQSGLSVALSRDAMKSLKLNVNGSVLLLDLSGDVIGPATVLLSSTATNPLSVVVLKYHAASFKDGKILLRKIPPERISVAAGLTLAASCEKSFFSDDAFLETLRLQLNGSLVCIHRSLTFYYFGQQLSFTVVDALLANDTSDSNCADEILLLCGELKTMVTLNDSSYCNDSIHFDEAAASTPLKATTNRNDLLISFNNSSPGLDSPANTLPSSSSLLDFAAIFGDEVFQSLRIFRLTSATSLELQVQGQLSETMTFADVAGCQKVKELLANAIVKPVKAALASSVTIKFNGCQRFILFGPSGCGKTLIAKALANDCGLPFFALQRPDASDTSQGAVEERLMRLLEQTQCHQRSLLLLDNFDSLLGAPKEKGRQFSPLQDWLCSLLDKYREAGVFIVATVRDLDSIGSTIRSRFDMEVEVPVPNRPERGSILQFFLRKFNIALSVSDVECLAEDAHGYTPADLLALVRQAKTASYARLNGGASVDQKAWPAVSFADFKIAFANVKPSVMKDMYLEIPKVFWKDVGGMEEAKAKLREIVEWPRRRPEALRRLGIKAPTSVLLYGPPGCSKTMIAKALATESRLNFIAVKGPEVLSKWVGDSEKAIRDMFRRAKAAAPCVIFYDEIDCIAATRSSDSSSASGGSLVGERVLTQLLTELDGIEALNDVIFLAATNRPDVIDSALLRPGRIDRIIYIRLPDLQTRKEILAIRLRATPLRSDVNLDDVAAQSEGYSGAELVALCNEAAMNALQNCSDDVEVAKCNFDYAFSCVKPRTNVRLLKIYDEFSLEH